MVRCCIIDTNTATIERELIILFFSFSIRRKSRSFRLTVRRIGGTEAMKYFQPMYYAFGSPDFNIEKNILPREECAPSLEDCSLPMLVTISRIVNSTLLFYIQIFLGAISHGPLLDFHSDIVDLLSFYFRKLKRF